MLTILSLFFYVTLVQSEYKYETKTFRVPLDHFSFQRNETFDIRYLVNDDYWDQGSGPIFFYTGNEGQIEAFAKHTGFMWEMAPYFKAKIVFAEHRYYGKSMPFGDKSLDNEHIGYLSSSGARARALALTGAVRLCAGTRTGVNTDYADLVDYLQGNHIKPSHPVIAFGGSYGGMLAAYFRIKYPHLVSGAIAASAPVHMFPGMIPCNVFNRLVTASYRMSTTNCSTNIRNSWSVIRNYSSNANGSEWLHKNWHLCDPIKNSTDIGTLIGFLEDMYTSIAMVNYPFASDFLMPLPAFPVRVSCQYLSKKLEGEDLLKAVGKVLEVYTNYTANGKCINYKMGDNYGNLDAAGWEYQACTEMVMPICSDGVNDMFEPQPWNFTSYADDCHKKYGVYPRENMARLEYGGNRLQGASNIVFSNGLLDPWTAGGILDSSSSIRAVVIMNAAHHLDLMPSNPADPEPVRTARAIHKEYIERWIQQFQEHHTSARRS